jgi:hypothetical protein
MPPKKKTNKRKDPPPHQGGDVGMPKAKAGRTSSIPNFTKEEDIQLCIAYVNVSTDPIAGTDQTATVFWELVHDKYKQLMTEKYPHLFPGVYPERKPESLLNRYKRSIQRITLNQFMPIWRHIRATKPSGTTKEDILRFSLEEYEDRYGKAFPFVHCLEPLQDLPSFDVMRDPQEEAKQHEQFDINIQNLVDMTDDDGEDEDGDKKPTAVNHIMPGMGSSLQRPMGTKMAKKLLKQSSSLTTTTASGVQTTDFHLMATSMKQMADMAIEKQKMDADKQKMERLKMQFDALTALGDMEGARAIVQRMALLNSEIEKSGAAPASASVANTNTPKSAASSMPLEVVVEESKNNDEVICINMEEGDDNAAEHEK